MKTFTQWLTESFPPRPGEVNTPFPPALSPKKEIDRGNPNNWADESDYDDPEPNRKRFQDPDEDPEIKFLKNPNFKHLSVKKGILSNNQGHFADAVDVPSVSPEDVSGIFTFMYTNEPNRYKKQLFISTSDHAQIHRETGISNAGVEGRYGWSDVGSSFPVITFWGRGNASMPNIIKIIKLLHDKNLLVPRTVVYCYKKLGFIEDVMMGKIESQELANPLINIGSRQIYLSKIPEMLHTLPKSSNEYQEVINFIKQNKDNPKYKHILGNLSINLNAIPDQSKMQSFKQYANVRDRLRNADRDGLSQKEMDDMFDKIR